MVVMKAGKCPSEALSLTNRVILNSKDHAQFQQPKHVVIQYAGRNFPFTVEADPGMTPGQVELSFNNPFKMNVKPFFRLAKWRWFTVVENQGLGQGIIVFLNTNYELTMLTCVA